MLVFALNVIVYPEEVTGTFGNMLGLAAALVIFHKGQWYMKVTACLLYTSKQKAIRKGSE